MVALTYVSAIDDPKRFTSSKAVGAHFGLTPKKYQSGETDITGRISKIGDSTVRAVLYVAAHIILTRPIHGGALKSWAMRLAQRAGMKKAKVALARKLAVVLHRMWVNGSAFDVEKTRPHACRGLTRGAHKFSARVTTPGLPEAKSRRRDDGRGQTETAQWQATTRTRLDGLILIKPHQVAALRRPQTEARARRPDDAKGIDQSRPVTEGACPSNRCSNPSKSEFKLGL